MGGKAFANYLPRIITPRMSVEVYERVLKQSEGILRNYYSKVANAIEGPGKTSYGDVDILVALPLDYSFKRGQSIHKQLKHAMNARAMISGRGNPTINLAIPWPHDLDGVIAPEKDLEPHLDESTAMKCVQVDIHICKGEQEFHWELFHSAHGDLWNILGATIRNFGLTVNNRGLFIRIPEIELIERKLSMVFLTNEPTEILRFLDLDVGRWWRPFDTEEEMFQYAATCRMFWVSKAVEDEVNGDGAIVTSVGGQEGGEQGRKKLKHNDRRRMAQRPIFKAWIDDFIPRCRKEGKYGEAQTTREEIRDGAFRKFGIKKEYDQQLTNWLRVRQMHVIAQDILPNSYLDTEGMDLTHNAIAHRTLKKVLVKGESFKGQIPEAPPKNEEGFYDLEEVKRFVIDNWMIAGIVGKTLEEPRAMEARREKALKRETENKSEADTPE